MTEKATELGNEPTSGIVIDKKIETNKFIQFPHIYFGLTKREYFAGLAMQGMLASGNYKNNYSGNIDENSVFFADNLLKELSKPIENE